MHARSAVLLALTALCVAVTPARAATDAQLLRRHAPVLVLDAREPGPSGYRWWAFAGLGGAALLALAAILRRRGARAC